MTDSIRVVTGLVAKGLKDSLCGVAKAFKPEQDEKKESPQRQEPMSTLARRRAERQPNRESPKESEPKILQRLLLCCAWNGGVFWLSILVFNGALIPALEFLTHLVFGDAATQNVVWSYMGPMLTWTFNALWILPLFVLSKVVNNLWFQDIADAAYRRVRGRPQPFPSLSKIIADILFSLVIQALFLIQGMLVSLLPLAAVGRLVYQIHMCLLYSMYAFEYKWFNMGWEVHQRVYYIECNWPYFVGFGLPLAVLTSLPSSLIVSGCVFSILFPLFIISANEAPPVDTPFDMSMKLFSFVISITDAIFRHSVTKTQTPSSGNTTSSPRHTSQAQVRR